MPDNDQRAKSRPYLVRYQDAAGATLTGFTVRGESELRAAAAETAARPEVTLTWRPWSMTNPEPWRTADEIPPASAAPADESRPLTLPSLPEPRRLWVHSGPCIYCAHGPSCPRCDAADSPYYAVGDDYPGPVCRACSEEIKRAEMAADPYYRGDDYAMFGDSE